MTKHLYVVLLVLFSISAWAEPEVSDPASEARAKAVLERAERLGLDVLSPWFVQDLSSSYPLAVALTCRQRVEGKCTRAQYGSMYMQDDAPIAPFSLIGKEFDAADQAMVEKKILDQIPKAFDERFLVFIVTEIIYDEYRSFTEGKLVTGAIDLVILPIRAPIYGVKALVRRIKGTSARDQLKRVQPGTVALLNPNVVWKYSSAAINVTERLDR